MPRCGVRGHRSAMSLPISHDAFDVRIDIERRRPQKTDQRLAAFAGKIYRERRWRGNGRDDRNSGRERFLHDLQ